MRYDTPVYFQRIVPGEYDSTTGDYGEDTINSVLRYASVMDTRAETLRLIYGEIKQGSLTIQLQNHYPDAFDRIHIASGVHAGTYAVDYRRRLRTKDIFIVSEVQRDED